MYTPVWSLVRLRSRVIFRSVGRPFQSGSLCLPEKFSCTESQFHRPPPCNFLLSFFLELLLVYVGYPMWILFWSILFCILDISFSFNFPLLDQISLFQLCFSFPGALSCSLFFTFSSFTSLKVFILGFFVSLCYFFLVLSTELVPAFHVSSGDWYSRALCCCQRVISLHVWRWGSLEGDQVGTRPPFLRGCPDVVISWVLCC